MLTSALPFGAAAGTKKSTLQKVLDKYSKASSILTDITKIDEKMALDTKSQTKGILKFQNDKIYIVQNGDRKVEMYYADKVLTMVEYPDTDFDKSGKRKVTTLRKSVPPLIKNLLSLFSDSKGFNREFSILSETKDKTLILISLKPKDQNLIKSLNLIVDPKTSQLTELSFVDEIQTKTTIQFKNTVLNAKLSKSDFQFTKMKTDEEMSE